MKLSLEGRDLVLNGPDGPVARAPIDGLFALSWAECANQWEATQWKDLHPDAVRVTAEGEGVRVNIDSFADKAVSLTASSTVAGSAVHWNISVSNGAEGVVAAIRGPALEVLGSGRLILPNRHGAALDDPWSVLADEVHELGYPVPASMQYLTTDRVALHVLDPDLNHKLLRAGGPRRELSVQQHPFLEPGTTWTSPAVVWQTLSGGWHEAADYYRAWVDSWLPAPSVAEQVRRFPVVALEVIKSRPEDDLDIPDVLADMESGSYAASIPRVQALRAQGYDGVELVGWFGQGHDTTFPDYEATEELGGPEGLHALIDVAHAEGLLVALYLNLRIANITNPTYQCNPQWRVLTRDGGPHVEQYGDQEFHALCPFVPGWQAHMDTVVATCFRTWGVDGVQFDQVGAAESLLCFDAEHGHASPASAWAAYPPWLRRLRDLARAVNPQAWTWIEGSWDAAGAWVDLSQDNFWEDIPGSRPLPAVYRYTMQGHPVFGDARNGGVPYWCKTDVRRARATYDVVAADMLVAHYLDDQGVQAEPGVEGRVLVGAGYALVTLAEVGGQDRRATVTLDMTRLPPGVPVGAIAVAADKHLPLQASDVIRLADIPLPAGQVEVVRLQW